MKKTLILICTLILITSAKYSAQNYIPQAVQLVHNSADITVSNLKVWVNDSIWVNAFSFQQATPKVSFVTGTHTIGISLTTATSQAQSLVQHTFDFNQGIDDHFLIINGILGNAQYPLTIKDYTNGPIGTLAPNDANFLLYNGCVNCGNITLNATSTAVVNTVTPIGNISYSNFGLIHIQSSLGFYNHTLTLTASTDTSSYGSYVLPLQNHFQKLSNIIINGAFNLSAKTTGVGFGLSVVPVSGGAIIPLTKVEVTTGLKEENSQAFAVQLSPNPSTSRLNISINTFKDDFITMEVFDLVGKKVMELNKISALNSKALILNVEALHSGVYILKINQGATEKSMKFIKE